MIQQLPPHKKKCEDFYMWMHSTDGEYTVKSGYKAINLWIKQTQESSSNQEEESKLWKKVWNKRGVTDNFFCPICWIKMESINHIFTECPTSIRIWFGHQLSIRF